ncbi:MAG: hypothetical protein HY842_16790 [Bacteroidetes bacterium]|nr:hypothetical protein [Bacteroidota bacterium]
MKQPAWKKILSYLVDIQLDSASTHLNPRLDLSLRRGRCYLTTPNAVYSFGDLYGNFLQTFRQLDFAQYDIRDVAVLGFGMGSVPFMLERVFYQKFRYVGVEVDEVIAGWAEQYVLPELASPVELHRTDALGFVEKCDRKFGLVVVDIFLDDKVPVQFEDLVFLQNLKKMLAENGLLLFNRMADTPEARAKTEAFFENNFRQVFPDASYFDVDGNWVMTTHRSSPKSSSN